MHKEINSEEIVLFNGKEMMLPKNVEITLHENEERKEHQLNEMCFWIFKIGISPKYIKLKCSCGKKGILKYKYSRYLKKTGDSHYEDYFWVTNLIIDCPNCGKRYQRDFSNYINFLKKFKKAKKQKFSEYRNDIINDIKKNFV